MGAVDLINAKYEELQKARLMKMELEKQMSLPTDPSKAEEITGDLRRLESVIPQLEAEFEDLKKGRVEDLEKKYEGKAANDSVIDPVMEGTTERYDSDRMDFRNEKLA